jgi:hypothetical protein
MWVRDFSNKIGNRIYDELKTISVSEAQKIVAETKSFLTN